jgi:hypothetical protein
MTPRRAGGPTRKRWTPRGTPTSSSPAPWRCSCRAPRKAGTSPAASPSVVFACEQPRPEGSVNIHFLNLDTDEAGGPLSAGKLARRQAEIAAMVRHLRRHFPQVTHIRGRSWLYHLEAYRRIFPPAYADSRQPYDGPVTLHGNGLWGQTIDSWERVRPDVAEAVIAALPRLDPQAPWKAFPLQGLATSAPVAAFEAFYGLA